MSRSSRSERGSGDRCDGGSGGRCDGGSGGRCDGGPGCRCDVGLLGHGGAAFARSDARAQTEPIAALVALLVVGVGLALYAGVAADATPESERSSAAPAMERLSSVAVTDGTIDPSAIPAPEELAPAGQCVAVTLLYDGRQRRFGPDAPSEADRAARSVAVRVAPGDRRPGRVVVEVWT